MSFELYYHPLSSYCWKALIALYEADVPFEKHLVNLGDPAQRAAFLELTPLGKFPLLRDTDPDRCIPESSILIEYLALRAPSAARLFPSSPELALEARARDRFFDLYVMDPMQKIVGDKLRPPAERDARGVAEAHARLDTAYAIAERFLRESGWAVGNDFSLADCAAAPALFYANKVHPLPHASRSRAYLARLEARPSFARVLREAEPFMSMFPG
ncbi:MAG TPA: glutathione S-transferase family protein [Polyangiaceae bacterium]|nr:glutathione S-transferase family protein [Polyangiaceae bacterium]